MKSKRTITKELVLAAAAPPALVSDLRELIQSARVTVAQAVDSALTTLYWQIGQGVRRDILREKRADYGAEIVSALGRQLPWIHFKRLDLLGRQDLERKLHQAVLLARARWGAVKSADQQK